MRWLFTVAVLGCSLPLLAQAPARQAAPTIGQIFIVGNSVTRQSVILDALELYPGQLLCLPELADAERRLAALKLFAIDADKGIRPRVSVLDPNGDSAIKDILVEVQETSTSAVRVDVGFAAGQGTVLRLVLEERNFDPLFYPTSIEDLQSGRAFRGGGLPLRLTLLEVPLGLRLPAMPVRVNHAELAGKLFRQLAAH